MTFLNNQKGFTLLEVALVVAFSIGIWICVGHTFSAGIQASQTIHNGQEKIHEAQSALSRMTEDLITLTPERLIGIYTDAIEFMDGNGNTVVYEVSSESKLLRDSETVAENISELSISCLDQDGQVTAVANDVRKIAITLSLTTSHASDAIALSTAVLPRGYIYSSYGK